MIYYIDSKATSGSRISIWDGKSLGGDYLKPQSYSKHTKYESHKQTKYESQEPLSVFLHDKCYLVCIFI
jgi:hypothetical protein